MSSTTPGTTPGITHKYLYLRIFEDGTVEYHNPLDVDLTKHMMVQTRLGNGTAITQGTTPENDPGSSIGLSYQFEY